MAAKTRAKGKGQGAKGEGSRHEPQRAKPKMQTADRRPQGVPAFVEPLIAALKNHKGGDKISSRAILAKAKALADKAEEIRSAHRMKARTSVEALLRNTAPLSDEAKTFMDSLAGEVKRRRDEPRLRPEHWEHELAALVHRIPPGWLKVHMRGLLEPASDVPEAAWDEDRVLEHVPPKTVEAFYDCMLLENQLLPWRNGRDSLGMSDMSRILQNAEETMERLCGRLPSLSDTELQRLEACLREAHDL